MVRDIFGAVQILAKELVPVITLLTFKKICLFAGKPMARSLKESDLKKVIIAKM